MKKIIECPRCHLSVDAENDTCPFCTEDLTNVKLQSKGVSVTANSSNDISKGATEIVPAVTDLENEPVEAKAKKKLSFISTLYFS